MTMTQRLVIVSCSKKHEKDREQILLMQSFVHGGYAKYADLDMVFENSDGLPKVYNRKLAQYAGSGAEFIVFVHDDVYLDDLKLYDKLSTAHRNLGYHIIGVAGATRVQMSDPALWHLMAKRRDFRGYALHFTKTGRIMCSSFGPTPDEVAVVDGVFIAAHLPSVVSSGWRFNENYEFHHYDLAGCLDARAKGLKVGVYPIHLIHESPGLDSVSNPLWKGSNERFLSEYGAAS